MGNIFRLIARVWSGFSFGFVMIFVIGNAFFPGGPMPTASEWMILLFLFPGGVAAGIAAAWKWEFIGSVITLGCLSAFYIIQTAVSGRVPGGPYFLLVAAPSFLFLISWFVAGEKNFLK